MPPATAAQQREAGEGSHSLLVREAKPSQVPNPLSTKTNSKVNFLKIKIFFFVDFAMVRLCV